MKNVLNIALLSIAILLPATVVSAQVETESDSILVINAVINQENKAELQGYLNQMMQVFKDNGGKPVARYKAVENLLGDNSPEMVAIISFPDSQTIKDMINGEDYISLTELRSRVFEKLNLIICSGL